MIYNQLPPLCKEAINSACENSIANVYLGGVLMIATERINSQLLHEKAITSTCEKMIGSVHEKAIIVFT